MTEQQAELVVEGQKVRATYWDAKQGSQGGSELEAQTEEGWKVYHGKEQSGGVGDGLQVF